MKMPQLYPCAKPSGNLLLRSLLVFITFLFSTYTFGEFTPVPAVTSVAGSPTVVGGTITINGNYFTGATAVLIGGNGDTPAASFTVISDTQIKAVIARGTQSGFLKITTPSGSSTPGPQVVWITPVAHIDSFSPTSGSAGTVVTINGFNFTTTNAVSFGGTAAASYTIMSDTVIQAVVGLGSTGEVRVDNSSGWGYKGTFTYVAATPVPNITSFTPVNGTIGTNVTIKGNYFTGATAVTIGGAAASSFTVVSDTMINAVVATGAGSGAVTVTTPGGTYSMNGFTYVAPDLRPHISSFTPGSASPRTTITIKGSNFTGATQVSFGSTPASSFSVASDSTITAVVFSGSTGWVKVTTPGGTDSLGGFTYIPARPEVTSVGVLNGIPGMSTETTVGSTVIINGNFFTGATAVLLGGGIGETLPASFTVVSDNQIRAVIARGTQSGWLRITTPAGTSTPGPQVIYVKPVPHIDSFSPTSGSAGTVVTIKGFNFTSASAVSFGGTAAASYTIMSDTVIQAVVGLGSTGDVRVDYSSGWGYKGTFTYGAATPVPNITSFTPVNGTIGTNVTIKGNYFTGATAVTIGGVAASSFTVVSDTMINAVVATGAGSGAVTVTTPGGTYSMNGFTYVAPDLRPHISSFTPGSASPRTTITIKGSNFTGATQVSFGSTPASSFSVISDSTITAVVFSGSTGWVKVTTPGGTDSLGGFTYIPARPEVTSILSSPWSTVVGDTVTINGNFFTGATTVLLGGTVGETPAAFFTVVSDNQIKAVIARGTKTGWINITTPAGTSTPGPQILYVKPVPHIDSFTPTSGIAGTVVTIKGFNFTSASAVSFGGTAAASYTIMSDTVIQAVVGSGSTGDVRVDYSSGWGYKGTFTYVAATPVPNITSFTPVNGTIGTNVTIKGNYFTGATAVMIGGAAASSYTVVSDTMINAVVATGAGSSAVTVTTPGGTYSMNGFTYVAPDLTPHISSFTPASGIAGTVVTIKGFNFTSASAVSFGGTAAASYTIMSDTVIQAVVGSGSTGDVRVDYSSGWGYKGTFTYVAPTPVPNITSFTPTSGTSGTVVTIKGSNFTNVTAVSFGSVPAASFTVTDSVIIAEVGSGATGVLKVTTNNGSDTMGVFTYTSAMIVAAPNPATGYVLIDHPVSTNNAVIKLTNSMGYLVENVKVIPGNSQTRLDLSGIAPGIYVIWWGDGTSAFSKTVLIK